MKSKVERWPETPVGRTLRLEHAGYSGVGLLEAVRVLGGNPCLGTSNSWEIDQIGVWDAKQSYTTSKDKFLTDQNHTKLTKTRDRSEARNRAIFEDFRFYGGNHKSVTNPWQQKAANTI